MFLSVRLSGFYKGILPPILAETPKRAVKVTRLFLFLKYLQSVALYVSERFNDEIQLLMAS